MSSSRNPKAEFSVSNCWTSPVISVLIRRRYMIVLLRIVIIKIFKVQMIAGGVRSDE